MKEQVFQTRSDTIPNSMIRISKTMLTQLPSGKFLKLEDIFLYGLLCNKANSYKNHIITSVGLNWFCKCLEGKMTEKGRRVVKQRLDKLQSLGLIKITRNPSTSDEAWEPYNYEVMVPDRDYELINTDFFLLKTVSPEARGLALALSTLAYKGDNSINYTDKEICSRLHISNNTYKKYLAELEEEKIISHKILSDKFFPIIITNNPLKHRIAELRIFEGVRLHKLLDWFEETFLPLTPSYKLNQFGLDVLTQIEFGTFKREKVEEQLREFHPIILD